MKYTARMYITDSVESYKNIKEIFGLLRIESSVCSIPVKNLSQSAKQSIVNQGINCYYTSNITQVLLSEFSDEHRLLANIIAPNFKYAVIYDDD